MTRVFLPEIVVPGKPLGRHVRHDQRSLAYTLPETTTVVSVEWPRYIPILDQTRPVPHGSCTGNAATGALGTGPLYDSLADLRSAGLVLDEALATGIYSDAEKLDGGTGLPGEDDGSSGLSVAKVSQSRGYISGYQHATSVPAAHTALSLGPFLVGSYWFTGMDNPDSAGIVQAVGQIRGGHEYLCRGYDATRDLWLFDNSWSTGWGSNGSFAYDTATFTRLLANAGDVTSFVPISKPAPTPNPQPSPVPPSVGSTRTFTPADADLLDAWSVARHAGSNAKAAAAFRRGVGGPYSH